MLFHKAEWVDGLIIEAILCKQLSKKVHTMFTPDCRWLSTFHLLLLSAFFREEVPGLSLHRQQISSFTSHSLPFIALLHNHQPANKSNEWVQQSGLVHLAASLSSGTDRMGNMERGLLRPRCSKESLLIGLLFSASCLKRWQHWNPARGRHDDASTPLPKLCSFGQTPKK